MLWNRRIKKQVPAVGDVELQIGVAANRTDTGGVWPRGVFTTQGYFGCNGRGATNCVAAATKGHVDDTTPSEASFLSRGKAGSPRAFDPP